MTMNENSVKHTGRIPQTFIYLGKLFRMFVFQNDWKVFPMAAFIAGLVSYVIGGSVFKTQEGTLTGTFAFACICVWNGFFNSIQVVCRERPIIKREHRSGMHISSYVAAHMLYQAFLCFGQTVIILIVGNMTNVSFPAKAIITPWPLLDLGLTLFLTTYSADMLALLVSSCVRSTTTAMTVMPFLLIFQLVFSGGFFHLSGVALKVTNVTITKWGLTALCSQADYNNLPMVSIWNSISKLQEMEVQGEKPIKEFMLYAQDNGMKEEIMAWSGRNNTEPAYAFNPETLLRCWGFLILFIILYAAVAVIFLEFIDRDKR